MTAVVAEALVAIPGTRSRIVNAAIRGDSPVLQRVVFAMVLVVCRRQSCDRTFSIVLYPRDWLIWLILLLPIETRR
ncbi:hypothetical protein ACF1BQ_029825 [Bradyrhizobium sp. RDT10]